MFIFWILLYLSFGICQWSFSEVHLDTERITELLDKAPQPVDLEIEYREIIGLASIQYQWYIGQSAFWVRLHPQELYDIEKLDKKKKYIVSGVVLDQNYGMVDVWVRSVKEIIEPLK